MVWMKTNLEKIKIWVNIKHIIIDDTFFNRMVPTPMIETMIMVMMMTTMMMVVMVMVIVMVMVGQQRLDKRRFGGRGLNQC